MMNEPCWPVTVSVTRARSAAAAHAAASAPGPSTTRVARIGPKPPLAEPSMTRSPVRLAGARTVTRGQPSRTHGQAAVLRNTSA